MNLISISHRHLVYKEHYNTQPNKNSGNFKQNFNRVKSQGHKRNLPLEKQGASLTEPQSTSSARTLVHGHLWHLPQKHPQTAESRKH